ncbi:SMI1/KNR4 family protein [Streptomyces longhuiensis]|uniref:SMI1/KNR4 family protein n=1 Tax=Streptomyces longhuiensis TaxID=2880933 RepID=UPI001D09EEB9|nr:SMI1/KNR4 family protein [Streptomyces longhuiensis]UDL97015.1 SMI1/KNR4 family protein [Streptomyces longhuiensis]
MSPELNRLTEVLPRPSTPTQTPDWDAAETALSTALPADYKELITTYGGGFVDGYLLLLEPGCANDVYDQLKISAEREEANDALWQYEDKPAEMDADGNRLLCWATTDNGEYLYWLVQPGDTPDSRPILINDESGEVWERYDMTVPQFLTAVLSGEARSQIFWDEFPLEQHQFRPAREV